MGILITGANGQLGQELTYLYPGAIAMDQAELDITNKEAILGFDWTKINTIINAAAHTNVDGAETLDGSIAAWQVNALGIANLAAVAKAKNITLVHISTEYVFDGAKTGFYTENDYINPQGVYARSKAAGDLAAAGAPNHYILRTSWVVGKGHNFVKTMLKLGAEKEVVGVVTDQKGRPTFANDLAAAIKHLLEHNVAFGTYNFSNSGHVVSWHEFTKAIFKAANFNCQVLPTTTTTFAAGKEYFAPRPANSALDLTKIQATGLKIRDWNDALIEYIYKETKK
jgi:dTDP-4-dehydrorhamnose reductase